MENRKSADLDVLLFLRKQSVLPLEKIPYSSLLQIEHRCRCPATSKRLDPATYDSSIHEGYFSAIQANKPPFCLSVDPTASAQVAATGGQLTRSSRERTGPCCLPWSGTSRVRRLRNLGGVTYFALRTLGGAREASQLLRLLLTCPQRPDGS
jgi:hypothetical protein